MPPLPKLLAIFVVVLFPLRTLSEINEEHATDKHAGIESGLPHEMEPHDEAISCGETCTANSGSPSKRCCRRPIGDRLLVFGGPYTSRSIGDTAQVFDVPYEDNYAIGLGWQRFYWHWSSFYFGTEVGVAGRFGTDETAEIWAGPVIRHKGFDLAGYLSVTPSITAGLSAVSDSMGAEGLRERYRDGDATLLFYLGPQIGVTLAALPNVEVFYRLHHRSGAGHTLGNFDEGYNANVLGVGMSY